MFDPHADLTLDVIVGLGWIYLVLFAMNAGWTYRAFVAGRHFRLPDSLGGQEIPSAGPWALYSILLLLVAVAHFTARDASAFLLRMPAAVKPHRRRTGRQPGRVLCDFRYFVRLGDRAAPLVSPPDRRLAAA
jgi:hypothetical protein